MTAHINDSATPGGDAHIRPALALASLDKLLEAKRAWSAAVRHARSAMTNIAVRPLKGAPIRLVLSNPAETIELTAGHAAHLDLFLPVTDAERKCMLVCAQASRMLVSCGLDLALEPLIDNVSLDPIPWRTLDLDRLRRLLARQISHHISNDTMATANEAQIRPFSYLASLLGTAQASTKPQLRKKTHLARRPASLVNYNNSRSGTYASPRVPALQLVPQTPVLPGSPLVFDPTQFSSAHSGGLPSSASPDCANPPPWAANAKLHAGSSLTRVEAIDEESRVAPGPGSSI